MALAGGVALALGSPAAAHAETPSPDEVAWCVLNANCTTAVDVKDWALRTAQWKYPESFATDGKGDAFRHCIWAGALSQRVGYDTAYTAVMIHEYDEGGSSTATMDAFNDYVGLELGPRADSARPKNAWGWIVDECEQRAENQELFGLDGVRGAY